MSTKGHTGDAGQEEAFVTGSFQDSRVPLLKAVGYLFKLTIPHSEFIHSDSIIISKVAPDPPPTDPPNIINFLNLTSIVWDLMPAKETEGTLAADTAAAFEKATLG